MREGTPIAQQPNKPSSWLRWLARKLLPPATPQPEDRESIWSISRRDAQTFFRLVSVLWFVALAYISYKTLNEPTAQWSRATAVPDVTWWQTTGDFALVALADFSRVSIGIAILAMLLTRPLNLTGELLMSLYQAMVNRFVIPVIETHRAEGRGPGRKQRRVARLEPAAPRR